MAKQCETRYGKIAWADLSDSFSDIENDLITPDPLLKHPEIQILSDLLHTKQPPITVYIGNLPYDLLDPSELMQFFQLTPLEQQGITIQLITTTEGKYIGRAFATIESTELARKLINCHGIPFNDRPVYLNLDGFFGRGKKYKKQIEAPLRKNRMRQGRKQQPPRESLQLNTWKSADNALDQKSKVGTRCSSVSITSSEYPGSPVSLPLGEPAQKFV